MKFLSLIICCIYIHLSNVASLPQQYPTDHDSADTRHYGNLFLIRDSNVHTLSWNVDVQENCNIRNVIRKFKVEDPSNCNGFPKELIITKKILPFGNTYLISHPYYRLYSKIHKEKRQNYKKNILRNYYFDNHQSSVLDRRKSNYSEQISYSQLSSNLFKKIEKCVNNYLKNSICVHYYNQEVVKRRIKRSKPHFVDPLYEKQWHLVSSYIYK